MRRILTFTITLIMLTSCTPLQTQAGLPNPASVYCQQNGNKLEFRTAADDSQSVVCCFPDGGECDEWAYYRGECDPAAQINTTPAAAVEAISDASGSGSGGSAGTGGNSPGSSMPPGATEAIVDWWGVIKSTELGSQYDDYFERQDLGQIIYFGIDSMDPAVRAQIEGLCDSGKIVHLYGSLVSSVPDYNGSQILVHRIELE